MGASGLGKSTLFRALAGLWPFGSGSVARPAGKSLFLPQRPYLPQGTLRAALLYPAAADTQSDAAVAGLLADVGLGQLTAELDVVSAWSQRLSGGEQQRLALVRALLLKPDWLFLDEATSALDAPAAAAMYALLAERLPGTTLVSITHAPAIAALHDRRLELQAGRPATLLAA